MIKLNKGDDDSTKKCKNFGYTFSVIFFLIFLYNLLFLRSFSYYFLALSIFLCILSYVKPNLLKFLSDIWEKFGLFLGKLFSPVILTLIYLITIVPVNLVVRILRIDLINKEVSNKVTSYWIKRKDSKVNFKDQF
ncbi:MAG: hypothetical protein CMM98_04475 [Rickettsiales bacterium]|nr:hypothetical protein [Rickettsiales bacterium]